ncbi:hypothetical protein P4645_15465 [Lysinibacillus fusiformis]|uniref:hypothetical protein n=1 Tax=Lysinibacillus fusiformis TaxID=28031 RepID=UPI002E1C7307|nr:hypothetical protein [Lysinibacillus fusiformis]
MSVFNYVYAYFFTFVGLAINIFLGMRFLGHDVILHPSRYLILALVMYAIGRYVIANYNPLIKKMKFAIEVNYVLVAALTISSWIFHKWNFNFLEAITVSKISLLLLGMAGLYGYFIYKRAIYTMNEKVKNPRIKNAPSKTYFEKVREAEQRLKSDEPYFVMGIDIENELDD